ncbi:MAG: sigma-70 family RNA polymerase sigma factor [Planctomycetia bacterium]|nr:sigma-70 family RNA polymerase sigma factor [Planctomycetia bacterium]
MEVRDESTPGPVELPVVWATHRPRLLETVQRRLPPVLSAVLEPDDVLQAAYLDAARRWETFLARSQQSPPCTEYVWLYGIVMARLVDEYRRHTRNARDRRRDLPWPEASSVQLGLSLVGGDRSPSSAMVAADTSNRMRQALDQLPDSDRAILWMRHFDELSFKEVAEHLGIAENAAAQRYVRALRKLREVWKLLEPADGSQL